MDSEVSGTGLSRGSERGMIEPSPWLFEFRLSAVANVVHLGVLEVGFFGISVEKGIPLKTRVRVLGVRAKRGEVHLTRPPPEIIVNTTGYWRDILGFPPNLGTKSDGKITKAKMQCLRLR